MKPGTASAGGGRRVAVAVDAEHPVVPRADAAISGGGAARAVNRAEVMARGLGASGNPAKAR